MRSRERLFILSIVCLAAAGCGGARSGSTVSGPPVTMRSSLDRTAAWVGDPVTYTLEIVCSPGYAIVEDDLGRDHLPLEGLDVREVETSREERDGGGVVYRARFQLAAYTPERDHLRIGPVSIRYYRREADGHVMTQMPVGNVGVPAEDVVLQSTLPESAGLALRVTRTPMLVPWLARAINPLGLALMALSLITVGLGYTRIIRRRRTSIDERNRKDRPAVDYRAALAEIRQLEDSAGADGLRHAFGRLDHLLRQFLTEKNIQARSLTPDEIESRAGSGGDGAVPRAVARLLRDCERVRYAGPSQPPSRELLAHAVEQAEQVLIPAGGDAR